MPKITLNGKEVEFPAGQTVMLAARGQGIDIPHYCWHPALSVVGSCRMCQVEVHGPGPKRLATACNLPCVDGMVVVTESPAVARARAGVLEDLLLNHPLDCPICDKAGECWLQDYAYEYGAAVGRNDFPRRKWNKRVDIAEHVLLDQERCILCTRCVRFLDEFAGKAELAVLGRGAHSVIDIFPGIKVSSGYQGNLADICPVGALTLKEFRFQTRVWYLEGTDTVCPSCSRGCSITLDVRDNAVLRVRPRVNPEVNGHFICDVGRFGLLEAFRPAERLAGARLRGEAVELAQAARAAAEGLTQAARAGGSVLVLASPNATNEELFLLKKVLLEAAALRGRVTLAFRQVAEEGGDGILRTGQNAANVAGLRAQGFEELDAGTLEARLGAARALFVLDEGLTRLDAKVELLIVQAVRSALAAQAGVVLPGSTIAEKEGTLTNCDGMTQRVRPALRPPPTVAGDFNCLLALGRELGASGLPKTPGEAFIAWADAGGERGGLTLAALPQNGIRLAAAAKEAQS